jgi:hypothetical protein
MNSTDDSSKTPLTGRIGRFARILKDKTSHESYLRIMDQSERYNQYKPEGKAIWWNSAIEKMETELGTQDATEVMRACGSKCCGAGQRKTARRLMQESSSVKDFLDKLSNYEVREGELEYKLIDENTIIGKHNRCFCGQVKKSPDLFKSEVYCQCSVEFNKQFFEAAFEGEVMVRLVQSILTGGDFCEFEIKLKS